MIGIASEYIQVYCPIQDPFPSNLAAMINTIELGEFKGTEFLIDYNRTQSGRILAMERAPVILLDSGKLWGKVINDKTISYEELLGKLEEIEGLVPYPAGLRYLNQSKISLEVFMPKKREKIESASPNARKRRGYFLLSELNSIYKS